MTGRSTRRRARPRGRRTWERCGGPEDGKQLSVPTRPAYRQPKTAARARVLQSLVLTRDAFARELVREIARLACDRRSVRDLRAADHSSASTRSSPPSSRRSQSPTLEPRHRSGIWILSERCSGQRSVARSYARCMFAGPPSAWTGGAMAHPARLCARPRGFACWESRRRKRDRECAKLVAIGLPPVPVDPPRGGPDRPAWDRRCRVGTGTIERMRPVCDEPTGRSRALRWMAGAKKKR
jgi:hypothetical protein